MLTEAPQRPGDRLLRPHQLQHLVVNGGLVRVLHRLRLVVRRVVIGFGLIAARVEMLLKLNRRWP